MFSENDYRKAASDLGLSAAHIKAFVEVEAAGDGFLPDGQVKILFERHVFYQQLVKNRRQSFADTVAKTDPDICNRTAGGYGKYSEQHPKLQRAVAIDRQSALESCSWGAGQIMGYHWKTCGYDSVQALVNAAYTESGQLDMLVRFLKANPGIINALRAKDWPTVARLYNGPAYAKNAYDAKLSAAYKKFGGV